MSISVQERLEVPRPGAGGGQVLVRAIVILVLAAVILAPGCKKKRPELPPQSQPPTATQPDKQPPVESLPPPALPPTVANTPVATPTKPKPHKVHKPPTTNAGKPVAPVPAKPTPVPAKPNTDPLAISPDGAGNSSPAQRQNAEQLLASAQNNINRINRSLSEQEQSMRQQVTNFIRQSRLALDDGDVERGYNLALKASQLSNELLK